MTQVWIDPGRPTPAPAADVVQAGFLRRWAALFLDQLILSVGFYTVLLGVIGAFGMLGEFVAFQTHPEPEFSFRIIALYLGMGVFYYVGAGLYFALMESSSRQATIGKMALGIKVVDRNGARLSFAHALGRWLAAALSYLTLYIGFLMAAFTERKQALHDLVAGTQVVDQWAWTEHPERQARRPGGCLVAFVVAMVLLIVLMVVGIIAAISIPAYQQYLAQQHASQLEVPLLELKTQVESHIDATGQCPDNGSDGFSGPETYARAGISRIVLGEFEPGFCGISIWMPPLQGSVERQFLVEFDPEDAIWYCTDKAGLPALPDWCH